MQEYKWDLHKIKNNLEKLNQIDLSQCNDKDKDDILNSIITYHEIIDISNRKKHITPALDDNILGDLNDINKAALLLATDYNDVDINIFQSVLNSFQYIKDTRQIIGVVENTPIIANNNELIDIAVDFSEKMLPNDICNDFKNVLYNNKDIIQFKKNTWGNSYGGVTLFIPTYNEKYILVGRENKLKDLLTLPHELFHYIFNKSQYCLDVFNHDMIYTSEAEGSLANILFGKYYYETATFNNNFFNELILDSNEIETMSLIIKNSILCSLNDKGKIKKNKLNKLLMENGIIPLYDSELLEEMSNDVHENLTYAFSNLIAFDLYEIYKNDPDFCFYLLKNIRFNSYEDDVFRVLRNNHITFMDDNYTNVKKYIKEIEKAQ